jgi:hypothetical protein
VSIRLLRGIPGNGGLSGAYDLGHGALTSVGRNGASHAYPQEHEPHERDKRTAQDLAVSFERTEIDIIPVLFCSAWYSPVGHLAWWPRMPARSRK